MVEERALHSALSIASVDLIWVTQHLYEQRVCMSVSSVAQACFQHVLQSSPQHWALRSALSMASVDLSWVTQHLYEQQVCMSVSSVTQD